MSRLPRVTGKDALAALLRAGMVESHARGSHHYLKWHNSSTLVTVPVHSGKTLRIGTLSNILSQAGISVDKFISLL
ncbi:MAG: type II toxin-antitoxin system HicA family toxin [Lachnospiraceae bacterium]|nr:type II toxin-antitoxin system HicA family toxin [Lachnospiraceae bacterium]